MNYFIQPNWPAPQNICAFTTLRKEGLSLSRGNNQALKKIIDLPNNPIWIKQIHSNIACPAVKENEGKEADAIFTFQPKQVCLVLTADCLPILLCKRDGTSVAAIHGGWRGLSAGIIESTLAAMNIKNEEILAWLGPGISAPHYEVGDEVRDIFMKKDPAAASAFTPTRNGHWLADLFSLAKLTLKKQGVTHIYGGDYCTYSRPELFDSFRRDKTLKGYIASLIWIDENL